MDVILLERIKNVGELGDKVNVAAGFGRNFLIPHGKAVAATAENLKAFEARRAELEAKANEHLAQANARAEKLNALVVGITAKASEEGKLYGSIGTRDIAVAVTEAGSEIHKSEVLLPEGPIHAVGEYDVEVSVHSDVKATVKIIINAE